MKFTELAGHALVPFLPIGMTTYGDDPPSNHKWKVLYTSIGVKS